MARIVTPLSFARIKVAKPKEKLYKLSDGGGLSLWVYPTGKKRWAFKYRENGKQKMPIWESILLIPYLMPENGEKILGGV